MPHYCCQRFPMRKRICIIAAQMDESPQKRFLTPFLKECYAHDYDVCIFSMYQKYQETELRDIGDSNIYSLIQFDKFDGVLLMLDTLQSPGLDDIIVQKIKLEFDGPVVVADKECEYFKYILMDHYTPFKELVNHLIEEHGITDIAFLGGKEGHPHSVQRYNGYLDALKEHNIPVREDRIRHGNYWYDTGHKFAEYLMKTPDDMPKAVACANDYMAIGVAARLSENGYRIPEDIAIVGYDSCPEGISSPVPLTSANVPAHELGVQCFYALHAEITKEKTEEHILTPEILIGGSCGCKNYSASFKKTNRDEWKTDNSEVSYYSDFNHITEDMLCQTNYRKFFETLAIYSHQIRPFRNFWMCFNDGYLKPSQFIGDNARRIGYAPKMYNVIKLSEKLPDQDPGYLDLNRSFDTSLMLPELYEERDYPTAFFFTPMFFEDRCFGYVVFNNGPEISYYNETYRIWMRNVNQGVEAFYRQRALYDLIEQIKNNQVRDQQTGLYNYRGFHDRLTELAENNLGNDVSLAIVAMDLENIKGINETYSINAGNAAINELATFISRSIKGKEVCGRLSNDEFLIGIINADCGKRCNEIINMLPEDGISFTDTKGETHSVKVHYDMIETSLGELPDLDFLINQTVNAKNHKKKVARLKQSQFSEFTEEEIAKCDEVNSILDSHLLTYYFQPIISVDTCEIYGYEALMRYEQDRNLTPLEILKYAGSLGRLYDVEINTFHCVLNHVEEKEYLFSGKKIFINSLPGYQLQGADAAELVNRLRKHIGKVVIEYTEGSELDDSALLSRRETYRELNMEVALDDYGSGYSNVNNLLRYNPKYVKIDHGLISGIHKNEQKRHFVKSIVSYAEANDIIVLAEGVETMEELRTVIGLGVQLIQGFYTGRPTKIPVTEINDEIKSQIKRFNSLKDNIRILRS